MGLGDFILIIDKLGWIGVVIVLVFVLIMFVGSVVDIYQFLWVFRRVHRQRQKKKQCP